MPDLLLICLAPFFLAALLPVWPAAAMAAYGWTAAALAAGLFALFAGELAAVTAGAPVVQSLMWVPSLGVELAFRLDGLSMLFALLITGIGALIFLYTGRYLDGSPMRGRCLALLLAFQGAMLGSVLADDVVVLFIFWELTSLLSFLLIGFDGKSAEGRRSALQSLLVTGGGGLALLAGLLLLAIVTGSFRISEIIAAAPALAASPLLPAALALVLIGAFTKSAQFPFHFWLPNAMAAPTPVSAYLHSATMVKLGVYLLARLNPAFADHPLWMGSLIVAGGATMLLGGALALREHDLKRILAYTTVAGLGTLVALLGLEQRDAAVAAVIFLVVHALYKACLFLVAGAIDKSTGTREIDRLGGLARAMPITAGAACLAGLSMAGLPPFVGFLGKELVYEAALGAPMALLAVGVVANAAMVAAAGLIAFRPMLGTSHPYARKPKEMPASLLAGPVVLAVLGLLCGLLPGPLLGPLAGAAVAAILGGETVPLELALWHGLTPMLALSAVTLALGAVFYVLADRWRRLPEPGIGGSEAVYEAALGAVQRLSLRQTRLLQHGSLRGYMRAVFAVILLSVGAALLVFDAVEFPAFAPAPRFLDYAVVGLLAIGALATAFARSTLAGIAAVGLVGFGVALVFLLFGAPDLAFTQFAVETLFLVILTVLLLHLPYREPEHRTRSQRGQDGILAAGLGAVVSLLLLAVLASPFDRSLTDFFEAAAVPLAHGHNVVNVILVDFRALDTLGEIAVLGFAGLALAALLRVAKPASGRNHR